jgi:hypothetical protein
MTSHYAAVRYALEATPKAAEGSVSVVTSYAHNEKRLD